MKRRTHVALTVLACALASNVYAVGDGFYLGLMLGPSTNTGTPQSVPAQSPPAPPQVSTIANPRSQQFGSRFFLGNKFNRYTSFEGGFDFFSSIKYTTKLQTETEPTARVRAIDVMIKGAFPFGESFDVFAKGGVALTYVTLSGAFSKSGDSYNQSKFKPVVAIGASYAFDQSWVADFSWTRLMVGSIVKNIDFYAFGLSYHFVNRYCGQFLCDD